MKINATLVFLCLIGSVSFAWQLNAAGNLQELLASRMEAIRSSAPLADTDQAMLADPLALLQALNSYEQDAKPEVRWAALMLGFKAAMRTSDPIIRRDVVARLLAACSDPAPLVWQHAAMQLRSFTSADFTAEAKQLISGLVQREAGYDWLLLAGVAQVKELEPQLLNAIAPPASGEAPVVGSWYGASDWAARLALARLGNEEQMQRVIALAKAEPNSIIRVTVLLGDIAYTRQPEAIQVLKTYLNSDERLPSVKDSDKGIQVHQYALDLLAQLLAGFPVPSTGPGYSAEVVTACRAWMNQQTKYVIIK